MEEDHYTPFLSPRKPPISSTLPSSPLCPVPEDGEITLPITPSSSSLKEHIIFCNPKNPFSSSSDHPDPLPKSHFSPKPSSQSPLSSSLDPPDQSWLSNPTLTKQKSNLHRSRTAPAISTIGSLSQPLPEPKFGSGSIVRQAVIFLFLYLSLGVLIYSCNIERFSGNKTYPIVDALYFCIVTMCTIGYGDITPRSDLTKLFSIMFVLVGFGFIDILLTGMVTYVLDLQENLILATVKGGEKHGVAKNYIVDVKKGRMRIRMKVGLALGVVVLCIGVGIGVMRFVEDLGWLDSLYLSVMSVTTVGYGDRAFKSLPGRIFASIWLLVSTLAVARAFLFLAEARIDKRHRLIAKWVLQRDMTAGEFLAADMDNNGCVSKSEYVIYKLKEMGKIGEKDIMQICDQFNMLDTSNCGKITLSYLLAGHH